MVRRLVFIQVAIGQGKFPAEVIAEMLADRQRVVPAGLAPAPGLTLVEVTYPE
jgi:tRNA U38,U39,U40 pseudouridine synthase TruA